MFTPMRIRLWMVCCLLAGGTALVVKDFVESGPRQSGHSLRTWLRIYRETNPETDPATRQKATVAVRQIGTNAIPYLIKWIDYHPGEKKPVFDSKSDFYSSKMQNLEAGFDGLALLGPKAVETLPLLTAIMNDPDAGFKAAWAPRTVAHLGKDAIPVIANVLTNSTSKNKEQALHAVGDMAYLGTNTRPLIPVLVQVAKTSDTWTAGAAIEALIALSAEQPIVDLITNRSDGTAIRAIDAVAQRNRKTFDRKPIVEALIQCTKNESSETVIAAIQALTTLRADSQMAVPAIERALGSTNANIRSVAVESLFYWSNSQLEPAIPTLLKLTKDEDEGVCKQAIRLVNRVSPELLRKAPTK